jgi:hypothetical protein
MPWLFLTRSGAFIHWYKVECMGSCQINALHTLCLICRFRVSDYINTRNLHIRCEPLHIRLWIFSGMKISTKYTHWCVNFNRFLFSNLFQTTCAKSKGILNLIGIIYLSVCIYI